MTMISAREFSDWLRNRFAGEEQGVSLTRADINQLTGRQSFSLGLFTTFIMSLCSMAWLS